MSRPRDAERTLSMTVDVLLAWDRAGEDWALETGLNVLRASAKVEELELNLSSITTQRLDQHLESVALSAEKRADFERALRGLERFGSEGHPPARLARILIEGGPETEAVVFQKRWRVPDLVDKQISALREDSRTQTMIERFIREVLPFSDRDYHSELIPLLDRLATNLGDAFWDALDLIAGPGGPHNNIDVIVTGALAGAAPDYERAIALTGVPIRSKVETPLSAIACALAAQDVGVALVDAFTARRLIGRDVVVRPFTPALDAGFSLVTSRQRPLSQAARDLLATVEKGSAEYLSRLGATPTN